MFRLMNRIELFAFAMMLFMLKDQIRSLLLFGSIGSVEFLIVECVWVDFFFELSSTSHCCPGWILWDNPTSIVWWHGEHCGGCGHEQCIEGDLRGQWIYQKCSRHLLLFVSGYVGITISTVLSLDGCLSLINCRWVCCDWLCRILYWNSLQWFQFVFHFDVVMDFLCETAWCVVIHKCAKSEGHVGNGLRVRCSQSGSWYLTTGCATIVWKL